MITNQDIEYIAALSRIHLEKDEAKGLTQDLERILGYIEKLKKLDVTGIKPTSHVLPLKNVFREDKVRASLPQSESTQFAVAKKEGSFQVPQVIE